MEGHDIFKVTIGENLQPRILWVARLAFIFEGEIKSFTDKQTNKQKRKRKQ